MADEKSDQEKTEEPSDFRREEFRNKGEVAQSKELSSVLVLSATIMTMFLSSVYIYEVITEYFDFLLKLDHNIAFEKKYLGELVSKTVVAVLKSCAPAMLVSFCVGFMSQVFQIGFLFAPEVLTLKLDRVNPINGMKRLFSKKALVEAIKGTLKFALVITITWMVLAKDVPRFIGFLHNSYEMSFHIGSQMILKVGFSILIGLAVIAVMDFAWEKYSYKKKLMMSKQEQKDELKEKEGNPEIKQRIRNVQREMSSKRMMSEIPSADAVIANPTHISIVIKFDSAEMISPKVVAKGEDLLALKIREIAKANNVPVIENIPLARSLNKVVQVGDNIPREHYKAVAEVLAFVYKLKKKEKALSLG